MRRQDIQLLVSARQGDTAARCEVGRRYLLGVDGFPHHVPSGIEHLTHASVIALPQAARIVAEHLSLQVLLELRLEQSLERAAAAGSTVAQLKLAVVRQVMQQRPTDALRCLRSAADAGSDAARLALLAIGQAHADDAQLELLRALSSVPGIDAAAIAFVAAQRAGEAGDAGLLSQSLRSAAALAREPNPALDELIADAVRLAEAADQPLRGIDAADLRRALEARANQGDHEAAFAFGRGLCGIENIALPDLFFAEHQNIRKGAAYLLRAADAGCDAAWLHLYRLHADHRLSVANPQMARFFLEKAATRGQAEAQRKLGALLLRESSTLADTEQAIHWLHLAAGRGDAHADELLQSLVLPVSGDDDSAAGALAQLRGDHPWLAVRLELARHFGLTKLEALSVDPVLGLRPWGLVVGRNPFVAQARLSAPRAIPAPNEEALDAARRAASLFTQARHDALATEGDLRRRSLRQRRAFDRLRLDESMFFADASAADLDALRLGSKWAFHARGSLNLALAA
jgi:TPR repeat protein